MQFNDIMHDLDRAIKREKKKGIPGRVDALIDFRNELLAKQQFREYIQQRRGNLELNDK